MLVINMPNESIVDFLFDGNSNVLHICRHFQDIHCINWLSNDLTIQNKVQICQTKIHDVIFDDKINACQSFHHFQHIHCWNEPDLDLDICPESWLNVYMPIESQFLTPYLIAKVIFHAYHHFQDIHCRNM